MKPSVSVIIIVKDGERYLSEAIDSVLASDLLPSEILVIDGGSTDRTESIARSYAEVLFLKQRSSGIANAYNEGIERASGELIAFLSHDDRWDSSKLRLQVECLRDNPQVQFVVCKVRHFLDEGADPPPGFRTELLSKDMVAYIMETLVARREVFDVVGLFDSTFSVGEDVDWFARARDLGLNSAVIPETLVNKRVHGGNSSLTSTNNNQLLLKALRSSVRRKRANSNERPYD
jgi:glycosyltransferase involved in cell wall biosynthesis